MLLCDRHNSKAVAYYATAHTLRTVVGGQVSTRVAAALSATAQSSARRAANLVKSKRGKNTTRLVGAFLLAATSFVVAPHAAVAETAPTVNPITCTTPTIFVAQGEGNTQLYSESYKTTGAIFTEVGGKWAGNTKTTEYNAIAYRQADNFIYAISLASNNGAELLRIGENGAVQDIGTITGVPTNSQFWNNGAFVGDTYYVMSYMTQTLYSVNLDTLQATAIPLSAKWSPSDFTEIGGYLWGILDETMSRLNPTTGQVDNFPIKGLLGGLVYGAGGGVFTFGNGNFGVSSSDNGVVSQIAIGNATSANPTFTLLSQISGPTSQKNDGTACVPNPSYVDLSITKSAPATVGPNGTITWTIEVTNNGPAAASGFVVDDVVNSSVTNVAASGAFCTVSGGSSVQCVGGILASGAKQTITITGTAPAAEGCINNSAKVLGNEEDLVPGNNVSQTVTTCVSATPAMSIEKTVSPTTVKAVGDTVTYKFRVANTGGVNLDSFKVNETTFSGTGSMSAVDCGGVTALATGAAVDCTATYAVTQADIDAGRVTNTATASGTSGSRKVTSDPSSAVVNVTAAPGVSVTKTVSPTSVVAVGDSVTYTFHVENTGNVALTDVAVSEAEFTGTGTLSPIDCGGVTSLAAGTSVDCTATYAMTQADIAAGKVTNTAKATANGGGTPVTSQPSGAEVTVTAAPSLTLEKTVSPMTVKAAGDSVTYKFHVTNTGNVTLTEAGVLELAFSGTGTMSVIDCGGVETLAAGASLDCTATYAMTQADIDAGGVANVAVAGGMNGEDPVLSATSQAVVTATQTPGLSVVKSVSPSSVAKVGDTVTYKFHVTNTGNVTMTGVKVNETEFTGTGTLSPVDCGGKTTVEVGTSMDCTATYVVTQADLTAGMVANTATVTGNNGNTPVTSVPSNVVLPFTLVAAEKIVVEPQTLAKTGSEVPVGLGIAGAAAIALGAAALVLGKRRRA